MTGSLTNRILIIDDNVDIHNDYRKAFDYQKVDKATEMTKALLFGKGTVKSETPEEMLSFTLESAYQGLEGVDKVEQSIQQHQPYALAFVDIRMPPGIDGIETIQKIHNADPNIEVVICSAYSDYSWEDINKKLSKIPNFLILKKPFDIVEIRQMAVTLTKKRLLKSQVSQQLDDLKKMTVELEKALEKNTEKLLQSEKMASLGQLAAGVAHEINNPMGFIQSNLNTLEKYIEAMKTMINFYETNDNCRLCKSMQELVKLKEQVDYDFIMSDVDDMIKQSLEGAERVKEIVQGLKSFSHRDNDQPSQESVNEIIESSIKLAWNELKYKCEIVKKFSDLPLVPCFANQLSQVFINIMVNAAQAIEKQGVITLETFQKGDSISIKISDTGSGIPVENIDKLFDPFFTTKPVGQGTGLGLAISYGIIQSHKGSISVESKPGEGTSFTINLPLTLKSSPEKA